MDLWLLAEACPWDAYRLLRWLVVTFAVAFGIWILDVTCVLCDPMNHVLQGHALWHILTSVCVWQFYRFHTQFFVRDEPRSASTAQD